MLRVMMPKLKTQIEAEVEEIMNCQFSQLEKRRQLSDLVIAAHTKGIELKKDPRGRR